MVAQQGHLIAHYDGKWCVATEIPTEAYIEYRSINMADVWRRDEEWVKYMKATTVDVRIQNRLWRTAEVNPLPAQDEEMSADEIVLQCSDEDHDAIIQAEYDIGTGSEEDQDRME